MPQRQNAFLIVEMNPTMDNLDYSKFNVDDLQRLYRETFALWTGKKGKNTDVQYGFDELFNRACDVAMELKKRNVEFHPDEYNEYGKELFQMIETKLGPLNKALDGFILPEPHPRLIWKGYESLILKGKDYSNKLNKPMLLLGDKVYGEITLTNMVSVNDESFEKLRRYHLVTDEERDKYFGKSSLFVFEFDFKSLAEPSDYIRKDADTGFPFVRSEFIEKIRKPFAHPWVNEFS